MGRASREMVGASATDLVVLDAMLADVDGLEVARRLRQEGFETPTPILFLAADYATKPLLGRDRRVKRTPFCGAASLRALGLSLIKLQERRVHDCCGLGTLRCGDDCKLHATGRVACDDQPRNARRFVLTGGNGPFRRECTSQPSRQFRPLMLTRGKEQSATQVLRARRKLHGFQSQSTFQPDDAPLVDRDPVRRTSSSASVAQPTT